MALAFSSKIIVVFSYCCMIIYHTFSRLVTVFPDSIYEVIVHFLMLNLEFTIGYIDMNPNLHKVFHSDSFFKKRRKGVRLLGIVMGLANTPIEIFRAPFLSVP